MARNSDIERLRARVNKLCRSVSPPQIDVVVWHEGEEPPPEKPWLIRIMVEKDRPLM